MLALVLSSDLPELKRLTGGIDKTTEAPLRRALDDLGVTPFNNDSVAAYKQVKARNETPWLWWLKPLRVVAARVLDLCATFLPDRVFITMMILMVMSCVALPIGGGVALTYGFTLLGTTLLVLGMLPIGVAVDCARAPFIGITVKGRARWRLVGYDDYRRIPPQIQGVAARLRQRCPEVTLLVDELHQDEVPLDPFLIAKLGDETYTIAVWDEDGFEIG